MPTNMMTCCKEKAVLVAVYEEKPRKRRLKTSKNKNTKQEHHHHHHHHHHHLHLHQSKNGEGSNRKSELLSYSQHLRQSSKSRSSTSPDHHKPLVASTTDDKPTMAPALPVQKKQKVKKKPSCLGLDNVLKCFAISHAKRRVGSDFVRIGCDIVSKHNQTPYLIRISKSVPVTLYTFVHKDFLSIDPKIV
ncbi:hypothetical protein LXL04_029842 [Taraxacum kok-saghyz]